jgi:hypothetical protein
LDWSDKYPKTSHNEMPRSPICAAALMNENGPCAKSFENAASLTWILKLVYGLLRLSYAWPTRDSGERILD